MGDRGAMGSVQCQGLLLRSSPVALRAGVQMADQLLVGALALLVQLVGKLLQLMSAHALVGGCSRKGRLSVLVLLRLGLFRLLLHLPELRHREAVVELQGHPVGQPDLETLVHTS